MRLLGPQLVFLKKSWLLATNVNSFFLILIAASNVSLRISPSELIVSRVEDMLNVTCQVVSNTKDPLHFKLEWIPPFEYSRMNLTSRFNSLNFQISSVQESDSGVYVCNGSFSEEEMLSTNVTVVVIPSNIFFQFSSVVFGTMDPF